MIAKHAFVFSTGNNKTADDPYAVVCVRECCTRLHLSARHWFINNCGCITQSSLFPAVSPGLPLILPKPKKRASEGVNGYEI